MDKILTNHNSSNKIHHNFFDIGYLKLGIGGGDNVTNNTNMSMSGDGSSAMSFVAVPADNNSSSGSNSSLTPIFRHPGLLPFTDSTTGHSATPAAPRRVSHSHDSDALALSLTDPYSPTIPLGPSYDRWALDLSRLAIGSPFAQGAFGKLYRGSYSGLDVAVKLLERPENDLERAQLMEQQFAQEVMMLATLKHPNIVRFVGACRKQMVWCIVTEYARGGSVRQNLMKRQGRSVAPRVAVKQALDVARGMAYVHALGFIHRDLKSDNLLKFADKSIKIADFGVARIEVQTEGMTPETGTYRWMAPEMIQHRPYNQKVDVYSFGIVLWELITGHLPFQNMTAVQAAFAVVNKGARPNIPNDCLPILRDLMTRCWDANPDVRPSFTDAIKILEDAQLVMRASVGNARFRCCMSEPMTID